MSDACRYCGAHDGAVCHAAKDEAERLRDELKVVQEHLKASRDEVAAFREEAERQKHWWEIRLECYKELGYALFYMNYLHDDWPADQYRRVEALCRMAAENFRGPGIDDQTLDHWVDLRKRIADEIENMC